MISAALILVIFLAINPAGWLASAVLISSLAAKLILSGIVLLANWAICKYRENEPILPCCLEPDSESQITSPRFSDIEDSPPSRSHFKERARLQPEKPAAAVIRPKKSAVPVRGPAAVLHKPSVWAIHEPVHSHTFVRAEYVEVEDVSPDLSRLIPPQRKDGKGKWSSHAEVAVRAKLNGPMSQNIPMMFDRNTYTRFVEQGKIIQGEAPEDD